MAESKNIPENYQTVMPYLIVRDAAAFSKFIQTVFDGKETIMHMRDEKVVMHGEVMVAGSTIMFADCTENYERRPAGMFIYVDNADERFQKAIDNGATIITAVADQPYGRSGGVLDPFGNSWWITSLL